MSRHREPIRPGKRQGYWYYVRRVPPEYRALEKRPVIYITTRIAVPDDPYAVRARRVVQELDEIQMELWRAKTSGRDPDAEERYAQARLTAQSMGITYETGKQATARMTNEEFLRRVEMLDADPRIGKSPKLVEAVFGGVEEPTIMVSGMVDAYAGILAAILAKKSEKQRHKWRVGRERAVAIFTEVLGGDRSLSRLVRADVLNLRAFLERRIVAGTLEIHTANKYMGRVSSMYRAINDNRQLDLPLIFANIRISGGEQGQRVAFAIDVVRNKFFAPGMFENINDEARGIIFVVAETGMRLSEACNLSERTIKLGGAVPHVLVRAEGRQLKTADSKRDIPLVGAALKVMTKFPHGFPRYRDNEDSLSALLNKALESRGLRTEEDQTLYSLRHTFEDRLTAVEAPEKIVASLMGHKWHRERYGVGPSLEQKRSWLLKIAFNAPENI